MRLSQAAQNSKSNLPTTHRFVGSCDAGLGSILTCLAAMGGSRVR